MGNMAKMTTRPPQSHWQWSGDSARCSEERFLKIVLSSYYLIRHSTYLIFGNNTFGLFPDEWLGSIIVLILRTREGAGPVRVDASHTQDGSQWSMQPQGMGMSEVTQMG